MIDVVGCLLAFTVLIFSVFVTAPTTHYELTFCARGVSHIMWIDGVDGVDDVDDVDGVKQGHRRRCRCHAHWTLTLLFFTSYVGVQRVVVGRQFLLCVTVQPRLLIRYSLFHRTLGWLVGSVLLRHHHDFLLVCFYFFLLHTLISEDRFEPVGRLSKVIDGDVGTTFTGR